MINFIAVITLSLWPTLMLSYSFRRGIASGYNKPFNSVGFYHDIRPAFLGSTIGATTSYLLGWI